MKNSISQYSGTELAYASQEDNAPMETTSDLLSMLSESIRKPAKTSIPAQSLDPEEAAAQCLQHLTDPNSVLLPREALRVLSDRNRDLLTSPRDVILEALGRQSVVLEAASIRFLSRASLAKTDDSARILSVMGLRCSAALHKVLGAMHELTRVGAEGTAGISHSIIPYESERLEAYHE